VDKEAVDDLTDLSSSELHGTLSSLVYETFVLMYQALVFLRSKRH